MKKVTSLALSVGLASCLIIPSTTSASETSKLVIDPLPAHGSEISTMAASGWSTKNGVQARVYTDRSGTVPESDTYIGVTGEKTSAGGTVYYQLRLIRITNGTEYFVSQSSGTMTTTTSQKQFKIDSFLGFSTSGTFKIEMKLFKDSHLEQWIGDWSTPSFTVNN